MAQEIHREERAHPVGARQARLPRIHADARTPAEPGRVYRKISYGPLLDVFMLDMRTYRGPNAANARRATARQPYFLGAAQTRLAQARARATRRATWKVIAADMPIGLSWSTTRPQWGSKPSPKATARRADVSWRSPICFRSSSTPASATRSGSPPTCTTPPRTTTIPNKAAFQDFEPFWEFVSGPIHAGTFGPNALDKTFGPQLVYVKGTEQGAGPEPAAELRAAVLRSCCHRRRHRGDDRDPQGRRR